MKVESQKVVKSRKPYTKKLKEPISIFSKLPFELKDLVLQQVPRFYEMRDCGDQYIYDIITKKTFQFGYVYKHEESDYTGMIFNTNYKVIETVKKFKLYNNSEYNKNIIGTFMIKKLSASTKNDLKPKMPVPLGNWIPTERCMEEYKQECLAWTNLVKHLKI